MSESGAGNGGAGLPVLIDPRLIRALSHVLRQHILLAALQDKVSPMELSKLLGEGLSHVSYHVRVLRDECGEMLELVGTEERRGATEHYYRAGSKSLMPAKAWRDLRKGLRAVIGGGMASDLFNDLSEALDAGKTRGENDHIARMPLILDAKGRRRVKEIAERAGEEVAREHHASRRRMENTKAGEETGVAAHVFGVLSFEAAWEPPDPHALSGATEAESSSR